MKKLTLLFLVFIASFAGLQQAYAHAVWIQSNPTAVKNQSHEVNVYYGEYPSGETDATEKWFSDLKDLEVWLISPSQVRTRLELRNVSSHLSGSFIPEEEGLYYLTAVHTTKELGGTTKYEFSSVASVLSGKSLPSATSAPGMPLAVIAQPKHFGTQDLIELHVLQDNAAMADAEVSVMAPDGWVKTIKTDAQGKFSFKPASKGRYVIEASDYKKEAGEWNGKAHTHSWKGSTTSIVVQ